MVTRLVKGKGLRSLMLNKSTGFTVMVSILTIILALSGINSIPSSPYFESGGELGVISCLKNELDQVEDRFSDCDNANNRWWWAFGIFEMPANADD